LSQHGGGSILIRRRGRPAMKLCAALDTSTSRTAVCVVNSRDGSVVFEATSRRILPSLLAHWRRFFRASIASATRLGAWRRGCIASLPLLAYPWCYWRPAMRPRRWMLSATKPTKMMRVDWASGAVSLVSARACQERGEPQASPIARTQAYPETQAARHRERGPSVVEGLWFDGGTAGATDLV
jgi:hypothetical protein